MDTETAEHFRQKAEQCRLVADMILNQEDPVVARLLTLAIEFETKAAALAAASGGGA